MIDRFADPLYTPTEVAAFLGVPSETIRRWAGGSISRAEEAVITAFPGGPRQARIPFVGFAEAYVLRAIRRAGVSLQRIRPALERLDAEMGIQHALASQRLYTDGAEVLLDVADEVGGDAQDAVRELVVVRSGQRVLHEVVVDYLQQITFTDGYAQVIPLPTYGAARVVADAARSFGQPIFEASGVRLKDALDLFRAGEPLEVVCEEYGIPEADLQAALRVALHRAA